MKILPSQKVFFLCSTYRYNMFWKLDNMNGAKFVWEDVKIQIVDDQIRLIWKERECIFSLLKRSIIYDSQQNSRDKYVQSEFNSYEVNLINLLFDNFTYNHDCTTYYITPTELCLGFNDRKYLFRQEVIARL